jgi:hypothetical protein
MAYAGLKAIDDAHPNHALDDKVMGTGTQNAAEVEERVRRVMREEVRQLFRGVQSDTGVVIA